MAVAQPETALLAAARGGDDAAFRELTASYARELHVHCYRMLGSPHDAEDALQETLLRAWRHLAGFEGRSSFRGWLYRIATNVCLTAATRGRRVADPGPDPGGLVEVLHLRPYPDPLLDGLDAVEPGPDARYDLRESVQLAFLAAIQLLPPRQRAVLLLRDVLGWSGKEVAELLELTTTSVNSLLQRARETLDEQQRRGRLHRTKAPTDEVERSLVRRYVDAWEAVDIDGLVALLKEDAIMWMPPDPRWFASGRAIADFFATVPAGGRLDQIRLVPARANRQPAVGAYLWDPSGGVYRPYGFMVFTIDRDKIAEITGFPDPELFPSFGLPTEIAEPT